MHAIVVCWRGVDVTSSKAGWAYIVFLPLLTPIFLPSSAIGIYGSLQNRMVKTNIFVKCQYFLKCEYILNVNISVFHICYKWSCHSTGEDQRHATELPVLHSLFDGLCVFSFITCRWK